MLPSRYEGLAYDSRKVTAGDAVLLRGRVPQRRARVRRAGGRGTAPWRSWWSGRWAWACPRSWFRRCARRWGRWRPGSMAIRHSELRVVGVTGTNGKTTTAFLVRALLRRPASRRAAGDGQVDRRRRGADRSETRRPRGDRLQRRASGRCSTAGDRACAMEVSSHALALGRTGGDPVRGGGVHEPDAGPSGLSRRRWRTTSRPSAGCSCLARAPTTGPGRT